LKITQQDLLAEFSTSIQFHMKFGRFEPVQKLAKDLARNGPPLLTAQLADGLHGPLVGRAGQAAWLHASAVVAPLPRRCSCSAHAVRWLNCGEGEPALHGCGGAWLGFDRGGGGSCSIVARAARGGDASGGHRRWEPDQPVQCGSSSSDSTKVDLANGAKSGAKGA
jgi:hypothetical protein